MVVSPKGKKVRHDKKHRGGWGLTNTTSETDTDTDTTTHK